ncbi:hypothetical protein LX15_004793 [Streptoalloteichus tenebrarius]|uniref:Uncharacterized protein n=1 Tax=Streptoalloteichus tenebrarius (strain ATCC 17920 / DSM 40477 / JCM 4838 / CBS 697.72 / NBRC 16177 / NCIMB 11028 / NRRL B-12390 / A12253. 1 / ISP 5477) TaxID=1933 RepID=A0ABT1HZW7_STRSD|nr:helix-turn-helix domain-containing protein [Streptoalloteichus tenebrarius]MCP2261073.1 hypothetical protein [Streptoalloteichus tenebrarius]
MARPVTPDERTQIVAALREHAGTREGGIRAVARRFGRALSTIHRIARDEGITVDRSQTAAATAARTVDLAARRAELAAALLDDVDQLRARAWSAYTYADRGPTGPVRVTLDLPPLSEQRNAYVALGVALDKHVLLDKHDSGTQVETATSLVATLAAGLRAAHHELVAADEAVDDATEAVDDASSP